MKQSEKKRSSCQKSAGERKDETNTGQKTSSIRKLGEHEFEFLKIGMISSFGHMQMDPPTSLERKKRNGVMRLELFMYCYGNQIRASLKYHHSWRLSWTWWYLFLEKNCSSELFIYLYTPLLMATLIIFILHV